jgi:hypothetical protein
MNEEKISKTALSYSSPAKEFGAGSPRIYRRDTHGLVMEAPNLRDQGKYDKNA